MSKEVKIMAAIGALFVIGAVIIFIKGGGAQNNTAGTSVDPQSLLRTNSHYLGPKLDNTVDLVEFGDYECPVCGAAYPIVKQITDHYANNPDFTFVFRNFPLSSIHPNAEIGAEAAEAAGDQGKYFEMHDLLFEKQTEWSTLSDPMDTLVGYAGQLGLDTGKFKTALENHNFQPVVTDDVNDGNKLGINATPTFYLNGVQMVGVQQYDDLVKAIDADIQSAKNASAKAATSAASATTTK